MCRQSQVKSIIWQHRAPYSRSAAAVQSYEQLCKVGKNNSKQLKGKEEELTQGHPADAAEPAGAAAASAPAQLPPALPPAVLVKRGKSADLVLCHNNYTICDRQLVSMMH